MTSSEIEPIPQIDATEAQALLRRGALLVDVREPVEWAAARIPGATLIPLGDLLARVTELPRDRPVILQCRSGNRSNRGARLLADLGYTNVSNLAGGILAWSEAGLPLEGDA